MIKFATSDVADTTSSHGQVGAASVIETSTHITGAFAPINARDLLARRQHESAQSVRPRAILVPRELRPAPPRSFPIYHHAPDIRRTSFYDLPAELRIEIYKLVLEGVTIHIVPQHATEQHCPHALVRTSRQVRMEVIPMIHSSCVIRVNVTDFNFDGLLAWLGRIPPEQHGNLTKNKDLRIRLCTTLKPTNHSDSLRRWLHTRADVHRSQPAWIYSGPVPKATVANDLRRRAKRMKTEPRKRAELLAMLEALGITPP